MSLLSNNRRSFNRRFNNSRLSSLVVRHTTRIADQLLVRSHVGRATGRRGHETSSSSDQRPFARRRSLSRRHRRRDRRRHRHRRRQRRCTSRACHMLSCSLTSDRLVVASHRVALRKCDRSRVSSRLTQPNSRPTNDADRHLRCLRSVGRSAWRGDAHAACSRRHRRRPCRSAFFASLRQFQSSMSADTRRLCRLLSSAATTTMSIVVVRVFSSGHFVVDVE